MYKFAYDNRDGAKKLWRIGIINGYASVEVCELPTSFPTQSKITWSKVLDIGEAIDVDIAFDGRWYRDAEYKWQLVTQGNPWLFYVQGGNLYTKHWTAEPVLLAEGVSKISAIRGWKNTYQWNADQGIIVAYIKSGKVYYRNYCQQPPDQPAIWEAERETLLPSPAQEIALFRTNDYRTGFIVESNGQIHWDITERNWANMAIPPEFLSVAPAKVTVDIYDIDYIKGHHTEQITAQPAVETDLGYVLTDNNFIEVYNQPITIDDTEDWGSELVFVIEHNIYNVYAGDFIIVDEMNRPYTPNEIERINAQTYKLKFLDLNNFNNAGIGESATLKFLGTQTTNIKGLLYEPFEMVFYPENLVPSEIPLPEVEVIWNE